MLAPMSRMTRSAAYWGMMVLRGTKPKMALVTMGRKAVTATSTGVKIHQADIHKKVPRAPLTAKGMAAVGMSRMASRKSTGPESSLASFFI